MPVNLRSCEGSIGAALMHATETGENELAFFRQWMIFCYKQQIASIMEYSETFHSMPKMQQRNFLKYTLTILRHALFFKIAPESMNFEEEEMEFYEKFSKTVSVKALNELYSSVNESMSELLRNASPKMSFFALSIKVANYIRMKDHES